MIQKQNFDIQEFQNKGFVKITNFFEKKLINDLLDEIKLTYKNAITNGKDACFENGMFDLFSRDFETFSNLGKHNQHGLLGLYRLCTDIKIENLIKSCGLKRPFMATRPVIMQNHVNLSIQDYHYKVPPHRDWDSMRNSLNSVVVWIPLVDVDLQQGPLNLIEGSHKHNNLKSNIIGGFSCVEGYKDSDFSTVELEVGDILIFSSLLVHKSGEILNNKIRWSCHFRYGDMDSKEFKDRKYEFNYSYKPKWRKNE
jgi:hypothetical protein